MGDDIGDWSEGDEPDSRAIMLRRQLCLASGHVWGRMTGKCLVCGAPIISSAVFDNEITYLQNVCIALTDLAMVAPSPLSGDAVTLCCRMLLTTIMQIEMKT